MISETNWAQPYSELEFEIAESTFWEFQNRINWAMMKFPRWARGMILNCASALGWIEDMKIKAKLYVDGRKVADVTKVAFKESEPETELFVHTPGKPLGPFSPEELERQRSMDFGERLFVAAREAAIGRGEGTVN